MSSKSNINLVSLILLIATTLVSIKGIAGQTGSKEEDRRKNFGWSLKKYEKKGKDNSKDKESTQGNQKSGEVSDDETIRVETNLVMNDVLVVNENGNAVLGLKQSDFIVIEDGEPQKIELFAFGENAALPRSIVLIIPENSPIADWGKNNRAAAKVLVDKLAPQDKMAIVAPTLKLILDFTRDKAVLKKTLDELSLSRVNHDPFFWRDYGTLMAVLNEMFDERDVRPIVIFQTPGGELDLLKGELAKRPKEAQDIWRENQRRSNNHPSRYERGYGFSDVPERVEKSRATVYSIITTLRFVGHPREERLRRARIIAEEIMRLVFKETDPERISAVQDKEQSYLADGYVVEQTAAMQVAKLSGGYTEFVEQPEDAQKAYESIFQVINNRYTVGYYSTNQTRDGKGRSVKIEVRDCPKCVVVGRKSYIAAKDEK